MHGHWVIPSGFLAAYAQPSLPLVVSLHGSDVFVAERHGIARRAAGLVFARASWTTACSDDLHQRAIGLGANPARIETVPYGVDTIRFAPNAGARVDVRNALQLGDAPVVFTGGRLVSKKGFEYLIDALPALARTFPDIRLVIAGDGDLREALVARAGRVAGEDRVRFVGNQSQDDVARLAAAADVIAVPSIRDDAGNVDGLPNFALEALASSTPVVATTAGGLPQAITHDVNGLLVPERDSAALASSIGVLLSDAPRAQALGRAGRERVTREFGWARVAERLEAVYERASAHRRKNS
jgi:glycosyltransferase involved in cell wall biosynthesis